MGTPSPYRSPAELPDAAERARELEDALRQGRLRAYVVRASATAGALFALIVSAAASYAVAQAPEKPRTRLPSRPMTRVRSPSDEAWFGRSDEDPKGPSPAENRSHDPCPGCGMG